MMKKLLTGILCGILCMGFMGCGTKTPAKTNTQADPAGTQGPSEPVLQVGYSREDITPQSSVPMGGYGKSSQRMSEGVAYPLYATCIAFTYGEEKVLLFTQDLINSQWAGVVRPMISSATGISQDRIMVCATHTHHTPDQGSSDASIQAYQQLYITAMIKAAQGALKDCAPATLYLGETKTEGLNFVRHYLLSDGTYGGDNFGDFKANTIVDHATEGDPQMVVLRVDRGEEKGITLVNWQAHPCKTEGGSKNRLISPDFITAMRTYYEEMSGMHFAYFTGAAGNQNLSTRIPTEDNFLEFWDLGKKLAEIAYETAQKAEKLEGTGIRTISEAHELPMNHENEEKLTEALEVVAYWQTVTTTEANVLARQYGFSSVYEASAIRSRVKRPATDTYEINAMNICGFSLVTAPYEMFSNSALYIKENSPFKNTMVFSCSNGSRGYFPTEEAYDYRSYEGTTAQFARGCAENSAAALVALLEKVK